MGTFITDGSIVLPGLKSDTRPANIPPTSEEWSAVDANKLRTALLDVRTYALGYQTGFINPNAALVTATGSTYARALQDRFGEIVNVKDYGAVGDGLTDDTAALQAAIVAASRTEIDPYDSGQGEGGVVFMPRGVYLITQQLSWSADGITLLGEGDRITSIKVEIATNPAITDAISVGGLSGGSRRARFVGFSMFTPANYGSAYCQDLIRVDGSTWWRIENVTLRGAGRNGLWIGGSYNGTAIDLRTLYCGGSGVRIGRNSGGTENTTSAFYGLYSGYNTNHGVHFEQGTQADFFSPILEFNGVGGAADGNGIRFGVAGENTVLVGQLFGPYFEGNAGWDIHTGTGLTTGAHRLNVVGYVASAGASKTSGYGFFYGSRAQGGFFGGALNNYTVGDGHPETFSLDSTCKVSIVGQHGNIGQTNAPVYRSGTLDINEYGGGLIQWVGDNDETSTLGRYTTRVGDFGTGAASIALSARSSNPSLSSWVFSRGDFVFNRAPASAYDTPGWICSASGTPGTWAPLPTCDALGGDRGDADATLTARTTQQTQLWATTLTQNRTVTLSSTGAQQGDRFRIVRTGLGAFTLDVGPGLKVIPSGTAAFVDVMWSVSAGVWRLIGYGTL